jgi:hypothetical protein
MSAWKPESKSSRQRRWWELVVWLALGTAAAAAAELESVALPARSPGPGKHLFTRVTPAASGVDVINRVNAAHPLARLYHSGSALGGAAIGDLNGDGRPDLFFAGTDTPNRLYLQTAPWQFEEHTAAGIGGGDTWGVGAVMADVDGDGDLDVYVCNYEAANHLYRNDGPGADGRPRFTECAAEFGLGAVDASVTASFCDYDNDGDLDMFLLTNRFYRDGGEPQGQLYTVGADGEPVLKPELARYFRLLKLDAKTVLVSDVGRPDRLYRNEGPDASGRVRFKDVSDSSGVNAGGFGLSATWWDYDGDGWMDLYVANDFDYADRLYHNERDGTFSHRIAEVTPRTSWFSMGTAAGDINNDGLTDFIVLDMAATSHFKEKVTMGDMTMLQKAVLDFGEPRQAMRNVLMVNTGRDRMMECAFLAGVARSDWSWAPKFEDFDNDGWLDLFISNGMVRDFNNADIARQDGDRVGRTEWQIYEKAPEKREKNLAYRNEGDLHFADVSTEWGLDHEGMSYGTSAGDLDGDGDQDLVVMNFEEPVALWRNDSTAGHRTVVRLRGPGRNTRGLGAVVRIQSGPVSQMRTLQPYTGFLGSDLAELHFGLGAADSITRLSVTWPGGQRQEFSSLPADHILTITAPAAPTPPASTPPARPAPLFAAQDILRGTKHVENAFDDFALQELLPNKLSTLGPGVAWGDPDGDGDADLFFGGAAGEIGRLLVNHGSGKYQVDALEPFYADRGCEDMGSVFFDADGDGDQDLFVVSGGYEFPKDDPRLADRLYLNEGKGRFVKAPAGALPADEKDAGSVVCAADVDKDGDIDLFIGGRVVPGEYPTVPRSRLLVNLTPKGGAARFEDQTATLAPELAATGLVTAALWTDADRDGAPDLLAAHEWGPVKLYRQVKASGTSKRRFASPIALTPPGWWTSLTEGDIDGDGDPDYLAGNFGLNTKYKASPEKPVLGFYADFGGEGRPNFVEAKFDDRHTLLPVRGKSCSSQAMPFLKQKFPTFTQFASASLEEIYSKDKLGDALRVEITELRTGWLKNEGKPKAAPTFSFLPLPRLGQLSPVLGAAIADFTGDGKPDVVIGQNFYGPQRETGRMDGGVSLLLAGAGDGSFTPVPPLESGIVVPGQVAAVTTADWNGDGQPDLLFVRNNDTAVCLVRQSAGRR